MIWGWGDYRTPFVRRSYHQNEGQGNKLRFNSRRIDNMWMLSVAISILLSAAAMMLLEIGWYAFLIILFIIIILAAIPRRR
jgi:hypothetical protein